MADTMESIPITASDRLLWMQEYEQCSNVNAVCQKYGISRKTFYKWLKRYLSSRQDPDSLSEHSRAPHRSPMQTTRETSLQIQQLRNETGYGPRKIRDILLSKHGISPSERTIWKIFQRTQTVENTEFKFMSEHYTNPVVPGHVIQVGVLTIDASLPVSHIVQYTAMDSITRLRIVKIYKTHSTLNALDFIQHMRAEFPFPIVCVQTKTDTVFTSIANPGRKSHAFTANIHTMGMTHVVVMHGGMVRNRKVDRAHRSDINEFYTTNTQWEFEGLGKQVQGYIDHYNNQRKASELGNKTPAEVLRTYNDYKTVKQFHSA